ncbi:D-xylose 1-dehydrogenase Gfo6 [Candidatus Halobonum tyrrellensis]|uniref:Xylose dehydrogenase n=1 Tax=Candidatus Halobonum tyrrellensis G22 TaxID=1324957 RepID=V4HPA1_9EURY|nr:D-xylose 1-dehydrogenase Gfo6 [Candidatus Halobonum tyrrellensis]ESP89754.1 xylose dehydrogenase [Candidatus Halobonum tyrrellensis G22]
MSLSNCLGEFAERDWRTGAEGTVRLALVGLGWWTTERVLPAIEAVDRCETTTLVTGSRAKGERVAADVETVSRVLDYDEFHDGVGREGYDAVYVCTPNAYHLDYAETAAGLGKAVLCEKPMEATVGRAERLVDVCEEAGVELIVGYRMQTVPAVRRARELVREGVIGEPRFVTGVNSQRLLDMFADHDQWRLDPDLTGYGTSVVDLGIYHLNTARFLLDADPVAAQASMRSDHEAFDRVPDELASVLLEFEGGVHSTCVASQNAAERTYLQVVGTEGSLRLDPAYHMDTRLRLTVGDRSLDVETPDANQMVDLFDYFAEAVLTDRDPGPDGRHGLVDMRALEAIHRSAESGERVTVDS